MAAHPTPPTCSDEDVRLLDAAYQRTSEDSAARRLLFSVREYAASDAAGTDRAMLALLRPPLAARVAAARPLLNEALTAPADRALHLIDHALDMLYPDTPD